MNETEVIVADLGPAAEQALTRQVTDVQFLAESFVVTTEEEYAKAAEFGRLIKQKTTTVKEFFKPMKDQAHQAHKAICDRENAMLAPLKEAEKVLKQAMDDFLQEQERKRRAQEEALRRAAEAERDRLLAEAAEKEKAGDEDESEEAFSEAVLMDEATSFSVPAVAKPKISGVSTSRDWEIQSIDESKVPVSIQGTVIRPVDLAAIKRLIKASKGTVEIPGVVYREVTTHSFRR